MGPAGALRPSLGHPLQIPDLFQMDASVCKRLYRKDYIQRIGYRFSERLLFEDIPAHYEMLCQSSQVLLLDRAFYNYRQGHPARRTDRSDRHLLHTVEVLFRIVKILQRFRAGPELWANFVYDQDSVLRWMGRQIRSAICQRIRSQCLPRREVPPEHRMRASSRSSAPTLGPKRVFACNSAARRMPIWNSSEAAMATRPALPRAGAAAQRARPARLAAGRCSACQLWVPNILYHSVADGGPPELAPYRVSPAAFRAQMQLLARCGYYSVSIEEWVRCIKAQRALPPDVP